MDKGLGATTEEVIEDLREQVEDLDLERRDLIRRMREQSDLHTGNAMRWTKHIDELVLEVETIRQRAELAERERGDAKEKVRVLVNKWRREMASDTERRCADQLEAIFTATADKEQP